MNTDRFKFRAWDKGLKQMVYPDIIYHNINLGCTVYRAFKPSDGDLYFPIQENLIVIQCTGLKDVEDKLIYEGDILQGFTKNDEIEFKEEVLFNPMLGYFITNEDIEDDRLLYDNYVSFSNCKIIGNIYEGIQE